MRLCDAVRGSMKTHVSTSTRARIGAVIALALVAASASGLAAGEAPVVEVFVRPPGTHGTGGDVTPAKRTRVDVATLPPITAELMDVQVEARRTYRGVRVSAILKKAALTSGDRALLHFANGMIVPIDIGEGGALSVDPLVALAWKGEGGEFSKEFPPVSKKAEVTLDPRPLTFGWNKVVVETPAVPTLKDPSGEQFSPWRFVDSLARIELVRAAAYDAQFSTTRNDPRVLKGAAVYLQACQYCHGVRDAGASYGWDFMLPFALHTHRKPKDLLNHISVAKANALEKGLMMPTQKDLTIEEIEMLWIWSFASAKDAALKPYAP